MGDRHFLFSEACDLQYLVLVSCFRAVVACMSPNQREQLAGWASASDGWVFNSDQAFGFPLKSPDFKHIAVLTSTFG